MDPGFSPEHYPHLFSGHRELEVLPERHDRIWTGIQARDDKPNRGIA